MTPNNTPRIVWSGETVYNSTDNIAPKCVIGLGRDGVLNRDLGTYCFKVEDFDPIPDSLEAVALLRRLGHKIAIITNQGGIEKGLFTQEDVDKVHEHMLKLLGEADCRSIDAIYYSASDRKNDLYAKPNTGMFKRCEREYPYIRFNQGYYVGDRVIDLKAAYKIGATPVLVRTGYGREAEKELDKFSYRDVKKKTLIFDTVWDFARYMQDQA